MGRGGGGHCIGCSDPCHFAPDDNSSFVVDLRERSLGKPCQALAGCFVEQDAGCGGGVEGFDGAGAGDGDALVALGYKFRR